MAAGGDLVQLVHEQTYKGQNVNNVFYFECAVADTPLSDLATWFETNVVPNVKAIQNTDVNHVNLRLRNLFNLAETYEEPLTGTGSQTAGIVELPSFLAMTARFDHNNGDVRPGFKRWSTTIESQIEDALWIAAQVALIATLCGELINPPATANPNWVIAIPNMICEVVNPDPDAVPSCLKYRLPENFGESFPGYPTSFEVYSQPTTQNSRKWYT